MGANTLFVSTMGLRTLLILLTFALHTAANQRRHLYSGANLAAIAGSARTFPTIRHTGTTTFELHTPANQRRHLCSGANLAATVGSARTFPTIRHTGTTKALSYLYRNCHAMK